MPPLVPAILTGFALAFARAVGEYGSVIFIAGNIPYVSEIAPLLIIIKLEEFNYAGATAIAAIMLAISFADAAGHQRCSRPIAAGGSAMSEAHRGRLPARTSRDDERGHADRRSR